MNYVTPSLIAIGWLMAVAFGQLAIDVRRARRFRQHTDQAIEVTR